MKDESVGARIRSLREHRHWSQARLAEEAGLHQKTISKTETETTVPHPSTINKIAAAFDMHPRDLYGRAAPDDPRD